MIAANNDAGKRKFDFGAHQSAPMLAGVAYETGPARPSLSFYRLAPPVALDIHLEKLWRDGRDDRSRRAPLRDHRTWRSAIILNRPVSHVTVTDPRHPSFGSELVVLPERSGRRRRGLRCPRSAYAP